MCIGRGRSTEASPPIPRPLSPLRPIASTRRPGVELRISSVRAARGGLSGSRLQPRHNLLAVRSSLVDGPRGRRLEHQAGRGAARRGKEAGPAAMPAGSWGSRANRRCEKPRLITESASIVVSPCAQSRPSSSVVPSGPLRRRSFVAARTKPSRRSSDNPLGARFFATVRAIGGGEYTARRYAIDIFTLARFARGSRGNRVGQP